MKKILFILLVFYSQKALCKDNVWLRGKITNPISDSITVSPYIASVPYQANNHAVKLDQDGNFTISFQVPEGFKALRIVHGNQETELFVQAGADLTLTLDAKNFDSSLQYDGKGKELANFMAQHMLAIPQRIEIQGQMIADKEPKEFEAALKQLENNELSFLEKQGKNLPAGFSEYFKAQLRYCVYNVMIKYPNVHEMMKQKSMNIKMIPKENYAVINDIPDDFNDKYISMPSYYEYITNIFMARISKAKAESNINPVNALFDPTIIDTSLTLVYKLMPPKTAQYSAASSIYMNIAMSLSPLEVTEHEYEVYKQHFPKSPYLENVKQALLLKKTIASGKPEIDFDIVTPEGQKMKLSSLKGNVVYIDFWSSGCVPCLAEMPDARKVRDHFTDKSVRFVYISLDRDDATWKKAIKRFSIDGINMRVDEQYESTIVKKYGVYGTPSHFLVDREGKFASTDDLARPGDTEKLIGQIEQLLQ